MKLLIIPLLAFVFSGCATLQFEIKEADTRLMTGTERLIVSENNRISTKSIAGGMHIDNTGVFINPFVERAAATNEILMLGFVISNRTEVTTMGGPNSLGVIEKLNCRVDGQSVINMDASNQRVDSSGPITFNSIARYATVDRVETGIVRTTLDEFRSIANASSIECRIIGSRRTVLYEASDISPQFLPNIRRFYTERVR